MFQNTRRDQSSSEFFRFLNNDSPDYLKIFLKKREFNHYELKTDIHGAYLISLSFLSGNELPDKRGLIWLKKKEFLEEITGILKDFLKPQNQASESLKTSPQTITKKVRLNTNSRTIWS